MLRRALLPALAICLLSAGARAQDIGPAPAGAAPANAPVPTAPREPRHHHHHRGQREAPKPQPAAEPQGPQPLEFDERFVLETGRIPFTPMAPHTLSFQIHGEAQLRLQAYSNVPLEGRVGDPPGQSDALGSNWRMLHWLRLKPVFQYSDKLRIVGEIDVPGGMLAGQRDVLVSAARDSYEQPIWYQVRPRQLYLEYLSPIGLLRAGQQTEYWGMGLIANDGDHPTLFGDYRRGSIVERLLFATKPGGKSSPLTLAIAGDVVYQDPFASLVNDIPKSINPADDFAAVTPNAGAAGALPTVGHDRALEVVGVARYQERHLEAGLYGVYRHQERSAFASDELTPFDEYLQVGVVDFAGKFNAPVPGSSGFVFGEWEGAYIGGRTNYVRSVEEFQSGKDQSIQTWGGAARLGAVHVTGKGARAWGDFVISLEYGYATGDADPYSGVTHRFTFDENHHIGLVLFDHVLAWKTARAATLAQDPRLSFRPPPGADFLPSNGGVFGASYLNPTIVVRPRRWIDLKGGVVLAQTTADFVDPFRVGAFGKYVNYDGGSPKNHDLGVELDLGTDVRIPIGGAMTAQVGAEGGVLLPGAAFDDPEGNKLPNQYLVQGKLGLQF